METHPHPELLRLIDRQAIIDTLNRLFIYTDNRDWEAVKTCFTPVVQFDMSSAGGGAPVSITPKQIVEAWDEQLRHLDALHHQAGNYRVTLDGNRAEAFCYGTATHYLASALQGHTRTFVGSYDFLLERSEQGWKISSFAFHLKFMEGNVELR